MAEVIIGRAPENMTPMCRSYIVSVGVGDSCTVYLPVPVICSIVLTNGGASIANSWTLSSSSTSYVLTPGGGSVGSGFWAVLNDDGTELTIGTSSSFKSASCIALAFFKYFLAH
jgi:hypothetical protein